MSEGSEPTFHDHHHHHHFLQCHPQVFASGSVPVRYGAPAPSSNHAFQCPQQHVINGSNTIGVSSQCPFVGNKSGGGWILPNMMGSYGSGPPLLVGTPLETSKELSSMPNHYSDPECFDVCLKVVYSSLIHVCLNV
uniref:Uncharacterized protein n=1 Tax=Cajanus cajan TaxID=3821 RepID=A0A151SVJ7_CAJCA|nr:hypothetical protein KK1_014243 [Cajanus cajan]